MYELQYFDEEKNVWLTAWWDAETIEECRERAIKGYENRIIRIMVEW